MRKWKPITTWLVASLIATWAVPPARPVRAASPRAAADPRIAAVTEGLEAREQRLRELLVSYDFHVVRPLGPTAASKGTAEVNRTRATWARSARRLRFEQTVRMPGRRAATHMQSVYDGEKILSRFWRPPPQDRRKPDEQVSSGQPMIGVIQSGGDTLGITYWGAPLPDALRNAPSVRCLGYERVGADRCLVLELKSRQGQQRRARWWLDLKHGLLLRKAQQYERGQLVMELVASQPREWRPGVFLATRIDHRIMSYNPSGPSSLQAAPLSVRFLGTCIVRTVQIGGLPARLFSAAPASKAAFDARYGHDYGVLPRRPTQRELDDLTDAARRWLTAASCPVRVQMKGHPSQSPECGPQSLYIVSRLLGVPASIDDLCRLSKAGVDGTTLLALRDAARARGLSAVGMRLTFRDLLRTHGPIIGVLPYHFYVVVGFRGRTAVIINPPDVIACVPEAKMRTIWDGRALLVRREK